LAGGKDEMHPILNHVQITVRSGLDKVDAKTRREEGFLVSKIHLVHIPTSREQRHRMTEDLSCELSLPVNFLKEEVVTQRKRKISPDKKQSRANGAEHQPQQQKKQQQQQQQQSITKEEKEKDCSACAETHNKRRRISEDSVVALPE